MAPKKSTTKKVVEAPPRPDEVPAVQDAPATEEPSVPELEVVKKKKGRGRPAGGPKGARGDKTKARKKKRYESFSFSLNWGSLLILQCLTWHSNS